MLLHGYEIKIYHSDFMPKVVKLLTHLWGENQDENMIYFQWKYNDNPFTEEPIGIVALHKGEVVGFRGYFATRWKIRDERDAFTVLSPSDGCVHPDHRRKKLYVAMGEFAMDALAAQYNIFFNFSASIASEASNLRNGFIPLIKKSYLNRNNMLGLMKFIMTLNRREEIKDGKINFGHFGHISVSNQPKPKEMSDLVNKLETNNRWFKLLQNEHFFRWRYRNNRKKYAFYFYRKNDTIKGYVVVNVSDNNRRGYILDYSESDFEAVDRIIEFIVKAKHFDIISIYNYSVTDNWSNILNKHQFKDKGLMRLIEKRKKGEIPLFIRPVKREYVESDMVVKDIDIQKIESWRLKEICSDGA